MPLDSFVIPVKVDTSQVSKGLRGVSNQFKNLSTQLKSTGQALTLGLTAPLALLGRQFVKTASDAEETQAKFSAVFKELTSEAEDFVQATAQELGRSTNDLRAFMGTLQDTFVPLGFARKEGLEMSKALTKLTLDLSSFNNMAQPEVLRALQSAIVGNHETVRRFGVIINQTVLSQELMNMGIKDGVKNATEAQKAQARLNIIIKGTTDAQGDALRTSNSFANQVRRLASVFEEFAVEIGNILIPVIKKMIGFFSSAINSFRELEGETKVLIVGLGAVALAIGPIITALGYLMTPLGLFIASIVSVGLVVNKYLVPITDTLSDIANYFIDIYNESELVRVNIFKLGFFFTAFGKTAGTVLQSIIEGFSGITTAFNLLKQGQFDLAGIIFDGTTDKIKTNFQDLDEEMARVYTLGTVGALKDKIERTTGEGVRQSIENSLNAVKSQLLDLFKGLGFESVKKLIEGLKGKEDDVKTAGKDFAKGFWNGFMWVPSNWEDMLNEMIEKSKAKTKELTDGFKRITEQVVVSFAQMAVDGSKSIGEIIHEIGKMIKSLIVAYVLNQLITGIFTGGLKNIGQLLGTGALMFGIGSVLTQATPRPKGDEVKVPEMAKGGIVTGPTLAMIGEAGAEAVIPLNRLDRMTGGQSKGEFVLRGQDLILALERAGDFRARVTG